MRCGQAEAGLTDGRRGHGTTGVHGGRGRRLVSGSPDGLVELAIEPPCYLAPGIDTLFGRQRVELLTLSLEDPDGFIAAVNDPTGG